MKKTSSLTIRILIALLIFVLFVVGLIYLFQTTLLDDFYIKNKISTLETTANNIAGNIENENLNKILDNLTLSNEVCVRIVSKRASITGYNQNSACALRRVDPDMIDQMTKEVVDNGGEKLMSNWRFMTGDKSEDIYIYGKLADDNLILVSSMVTPLAATLSTLRQQYVVIIGIVLLSTIILAYIFSKIILKPILKISKEVEKLPKGKYDGEVVKSNTKEFVELNKTLLEANNQIIKADKAKKDLLANVSHDLRTPLTMIVGYGEMIRDIKEENNEKNINIIIDEAKRLSSLVDDLVDISNLENDQIVLNIKEISLNKFLEDIYKQYEKYFSSQNVKFELKLIEDENIHIDSKRISQVIYNFINNALSYNSKDNKEIILGVEQVDGKKRIYVYDNGDGIAPENIDYIWDRYYKVDKQHKRAHLGSGIGLALSKSILEAHKLKYGVDSKLKEYSKFFIEV